MSKRSVMPNTGYAGNKHETVHVIQKYCKFITLRQVKQYKLYI